MQPKTDSKSSFSMVSFKHLHGMVSQITPLINYLTGIFGSHGESRSDGGSLGGGGKLNKVLEPYKL